MLFFVVFESNVISYEYQTKESHLKHLEEYGLNKENKQDWLQYEDKAKELLNNSEKYESFVGQDKDRFVYDKDNNDFSIACDNGITRTLFKSNRGEEYWKEQIEKYG